MREKTGFNEFAEEEAPQEPVTAGNRDHPRPRSGQGREPFQAARAVAIGRKHHDL